MKRCMQCGKKTDDHQPVCPNCGNPFSEKKVQNIKESGDKTKETDVINKPLKKKQNIVRILFFIIFIGWGIYQGIQGEITEKANDAAVDAHDAGNSQVAIQQLEEHIDGVMSPEKKAIMLTNLAYAYGAEGRIADAIKTFKEAYTMVEEDSADAYLMLGKIALLELKYNEAFELYRQGYEVYPNDQRLNTALVLMYLDLDEQAPEYVDYKQALVHAKAARAADEWDTRTTRVNLSMAYFFNEEYDNVIQLFEDVSIDDDNDALFILALSHANLDHAEEAEKYIQLYVDNGGEIPEWMYEE
jgi:tetratricopeptide (TPR) repeat protein